MDHNAILLDNITFEAKKAPSSAAILTATTNNVPPSSSTVGSTSSSTSNNTKSGSSGSGGAMPAYNSNLSEQQSVEEFRKQMARYSSNV